MTDSSIDDLRAAIAAIDPAVSDRRLVHRRKSPRARTLKTAQIVWLGGSPVKCVVRNLSASGACLEVRDGEIPPRSTFELVFDADQTRRSCWVAWREPPRLGVKFR